MTKPQTDVRTLQDVATGEIHLVAVRRAPRHTEPFTIVFQEALLALVVTDGKTEQTGSPLRPLDWRVLLYLIASCEYGNRVDRFNIEIARHLHSHDTSISKALTRLEMRNLVQVVDNKHGRPRTILIHPTLCFRGKPSQRAQVTRDEWRSHPWEHLLAESLDQAQ